VLGYNQVHQVLVQAIESTQKGRILYNIIPVQIVEQIHHPDHQHKRHVQFPHQLLLSSTPLWIYLLQVIKVKTFKLAGIDPLIRHDDFVLSGDGLGLSHSNSSGYLVERRVIE